MNIYLYLFIKLRMQFCCLHLKEDDDALCANFKCATRNLIVGELLTQNGHLYMLWQK